MTEPQEPPPSRFPPKRRRQLALAVVAVLIVVGLAKLPGRRVPARRVEAGPVVRTLVLNGRVLARSRVELAALVAGSLREVTVEAGDRVTPGQPLARVDDAELAAALDQATAAERRAEARLAALGGDELRTAVEEERETELLETEATRNRVRAESLGASGLIASETIDAARRAEGVAKARAAAARIERARLSDGGTGRREAQAALAEARAARRVAEEKRRKATIVSPGTGVVLARSAEPGDVVQPGRVILELALDRSTEILVQPDEKDLASIAVGQKARAEADSHPGEPFDAVVDFVAPAVDVARGAVDVRLGVAAPPPFLRADMTLSVEIETGRKDSALLVPVSALRDPLRDPWVHVVEKGRAVRRPVRLGLRGDARAEVVDGLAAGDLVIDLPPAAVKDGERVRARVVDDRG